MIRRKAVEWSISWRHRTGDTPDYPWRGGGLAWGRTKREACQNMFRGSWGSMGDPFALDAADRNRDEFRKGNIEIVSIERWRGRAEGYTVRERPNVEAVEQAADEWRDLAEGKS